jgi:FMN-dependent NADH-azoreductase
MRFPAQTLSKGMREFGDAQLNAFAVIERMAMRFALADRVLISTPM